MRHFGDLSLGAHSKRSFQVHLWIVLRNENENTFGEIFRSVSCNCTIEIYFWCPSKACCIWRCLFSPLTFSSCINTAARITNFRNNCATIVAGNRESRSESRDGIFRRSDCAGTDFSQNCFDIFINNCEILIIISLLWQQTREKFHHSINDCPKAPHADNRRQHESETYLGYQNNLISSIHPGPLTTGNCAKKATPNYSSSQISIR